MMRKSIIGICILMLTISSIGASRSMKNTSSIEQYSLTPQTSLTDFTHTVFAEYATTTWCPNCPYASEALYTVYETEVYPFNYVTLVSDMNPNARDRSWFGYFNVVIPSVYFDGGFKFFIGNAGSVNATTNAYADIIEESGLRTDVRSIDLETVVSWNGNAQMTLDVTVTNKENGFYIGFIKSYVTEIRSRWDDFSGEPYHFGFLDFAMNKPIILGPQESRTMTVQWDGNDDHNGVTFGDIEKDNIIVQSTVFHWVPHLTKGYDELPDYTQRFLGFYVDESSIAFPE